MRERISLRASAGTDSRPTMVLMSTGKKAMTTAMTTFEVWPKPNQAMKSGAKTIFGVAWKPTTNG